MTRPTPPSAGAFLASVPAPSASDGNTPWASQYAQVVRGVVRRAAERAPRSNQVHLGPSEIGVECDRQIVGKLVRIPRTNHVVDPWPSVVGTAVHAWLADAFEADNAAQARWITEHRVTPHPDHAGTGDLYDATEECVGDHKVLGEKSMAHVRSRGGPPVKYVRQLGLYGVGYLKEGRPVRRVALIAYPRTGSSLSGVYVWERAMDLDYLADVASTLQRMTYRKVLAGMVSRGEIGFMDVPMATDDEECYFCPFYRPENAYDRSAPGCPGPRKDKTGE